LILLLRTAGGLGNQLFQSHYATLLHQRLAVHTVYHFHSTQYARVAPWELGPMPWLPATLLVRWILSLRIPQVLFRLGIRHREYIRIGPWIVADGYFMDAFQYEDFQEPQIQAGLDQIRTRIGIPKDLVRQGSLLHLRLGDFFDQEIDQRKFLEAALSPSMVKRLLLDPVNGNSPEDVMTNDEPAVLQMMENLGTSSAFLLVQTHGLAAPILLKKVAAYARIRYNGSTLAFWAAVLGGADLIWDDFMPPNHYVTRNCGQLKALAPCFGLSCSLIHARD